MFGFFKVTRVCRSFLLIGFNRFQVAPSCFNWCSVVLGGSGCFRKFTRLFRVVVGCLSMFQCVQVVQLVLGQLGSSDCIWLSWFVMFCCFTFSQLCYDVIVVVFHVVALSL